jgi:hypothetical protein
VSVVSNFVTCKKSLNQGYLLGVDEIMSATFAENVLVYMRKYNINNYPNPVRLNINGLITVYVKEDQTHLFYLAEDVTGLAYHEFTPGMVDIHPLYFGQVLKGVDISRATDLHKPRTEADFMKSIYNKAWAINEEASKIAAYEYFQGSFEDYMHRLKYVIAWLSYVNNAYTVKPLTAS